MKNKTISLIILFITVINFGFAQQNNNQPPEVTKAEANLSFWDIPELKEAYISISPTDRNDVISVGKLGVNSGDKAKILGLADNIANHTYKNYDSFLIAHKGQLLFESYYAHGRINLPHPQASATKAYTSLILGRAIQLGYLTMADLDQPLISFFKDLNPSKFVAGVDRITLNQALTMRGGLRISDEQWKALEEQPEALKGNGLIQKLLEHSAPINEASQNFSYGNFNTNLVMHVIEAVVPGTAKDFIKKEFLDKLGISNYKWQTGISGLPESGWRVSLTSRDMLKVGLLTRNKGQWNGEQLIPEAYIKSATSRMLLTGDDDVYGGGKDVSKQGYGYFWWSADLNYGGKTYYSTSAQGGGGQYIILIKELDLVIVVTAYDNDNRSLQIIAEHVIPAFIENKASSMETKSDDK